MHFALAVVYPFAGNLGGGGFMLIRDKHGKAHFLDYREKAPAAATRDMYLDAQGNIVPGMSLVGYKASGVPGSVAGITYAQKHYGKLTLAQDMAPAIRLATEGFVLSDAEARMLQSKNVTRFPASAHIYQRDGNFYKEGETFKQPELAATLTRIAKDPDEFYNGAMAHQIADFEKAGGGLITAEDLAAYEVKEREPIRGKYRGYDIITAPPPSSGGIVLVEILNILSGYDLPSSAPTAAPPRSTSSPKPSAAPTWTAATTSATPTSTISRSSRWPTRSTPQPGAPPSTRPNQRPAKTSSAPPASCRLRPSRPPQKSPPRPRTSPSSTPKATPSPAPPPSTAASAPESPSKASAS